MAKRPLQYNAQNLFVGPAPSTGFHFIDYTGKLNNDFDDLSVNHNLIQSVNRVQAVSFSTNIERINVLEVGKRGMVDNPVIDVPIVQLGFIYLQNGLLNEARLGFNVNYAKFHEPFNGEPFYTSRVCPISGFISRSLDPEVTGEPYWPLKYRDKRNIFLVNTPVKERNDLRVNGLEDFQSADLRQGVDPLADTYEIGAFGNCFINSYSSSAQIGGFPSASVGYVCENMFFDVSGSGINVPAVLPKEFAEITDKQFNIPDIIDEGGPSVLKPGDLTLNFSSVEEEVLVDENPDFIVDENGSFILTEDAFEAGQLDGFGIDFSNIYIQSYSLNIPLNRRNLPSLGYKLPVDRKIQFPVLANVSFEAIMSDNSVGSFVDLIKQDDFYDFTINLKNPCETRLNFDRSNPKQDGPTNQKNAIAISLDFKRARAVSVSHNANLGAKRTATVSFVVEIDQDDLNKGVFMSGLLNIEKLTDYFLVEHASGVTSGDGSYLLYENDSPVVSNLRVLY